MRKINREDLVDVTEVLLFDILRELKKLNEPKVEPVDPKIQCKFCGGTHDNQGQVLSCAKKNKGGK